VHRAERIFDLEQRVPRSDPFDTLDRCRAYDLDIRGSMIIPAQHMMKLLAPFCLPGKTCLEVGSGPGLLSLRLAASFPETSFFAVENNDNFLRVTQDNLIFANLLGFRGNFQYEWARYSKLPIDNKTADVVFSFCSINRWPDPAKGIAECTRVCRDDGIVILYDLARDADEGMISFVLQYTGSNHEEFMGALRSSFSIDEMHALLTSLKIAGWQVSREGINLIAASRPIDTSYMVGDPAIYETQRHLLLEI
jgi:ubiquinone/menaquinone biosynthesis C-methylase UbiE